VSAVRRVLREAWLRLMDAEKCERASDIGSVHVEQSPRGRALGKRELQKLFRRAPRTTLRPAGQTPR
jgi:predicted GNAT family N-acyltransferase